MAIVVTHPGERFTMIPNRVLRDNRIGTKARWLLCYIASHDPGYRLRQAQIIEESGEGRDAVRAMTRQLEERGYLHRVEVRSTETGQILGYDFHIDWYPDGWPPQEPAAGKPGSGPDLPEREFAQVAPQTGLPAAAGAPTKKTTYKKTISTKEDLPPQPASPSEAPKGANRATRLPEDFTPTEDMKNWARQNCPNVGWAEHEKFMDHFLSISGPNSRKVDWVRTWRNWMRRADEGVYRRPQVQQFRTAHEKRQDAMAQATSVIDRAVELVRARGGSDQDNAAVYAAMQEIKALDARAGSRGSMVQPYIDGVAVQLELTT